MANKREKQAKEVLSQHRKNKSVLRRSMSAQENDTETQDSSSLSPRTNGENRNTNGITQEQKNSLDITTLKLISLHKEFEDIGSLVGMLKFMKESATIAADVFRPELDLKAENESLKKTLDKITNAVQSQELENLKRRCDELEADKHFIESSRQEAEQERKLIHAEKKHLLAQREALEKEFEDKIKAAKAELQKSVVKEMKATQDSLASSQKSEEKLKQSNAKLNKDKEEVEQSFKDLHFGHNQLLADFRKLKSDLDHEKSRFSIPNHGIAHL